MIILSTNIIEEIFGSLFGILIVFPIGFFLFWYLPSAIIAKIFNVGFKTRGGGGHIDPDSLDDIIETGKDLTNRASNEFNLLRNRLKKGNFNFWEDKKLTQIEKLTKLGELRRQNVISEKEFEQFKKDILT